MSTLGNLILIDLMENRPAPGIPGRLFFASDDQVAYRDNGASWDVWSLVRRRRLPISQPDNNATVFTFPGLAASEDIATALTVAAGDVITVEYVAGASDGSTNITVNFELWN